MTADLQSALVAAGEHPNVFALNCGCKGKQKKRNAKHIAHFLRYFLFFTPFCYTQRAILNVKRAFYFLQKEFQNLQSKFLKLQNALHKLNGAAHRYIG